MGSESLRPQAEDFPSSHVPGDLLVPFASLQKELAAAVAKLFFIGYFAVCGRRPTLPAAAK